MNLPLFLVSLALFAIACSMIIAPIVWNIAKEIFGAALIMIALVLLAIAGLVSLAHAQDDCPYGSLQSRIGALRATS
jgi:Na+/melibiose symporter-like transporter